MALFYVLAVVGGGVVASPNAGVQDVFIFFGYFVLFTGLRGQTPGKWAAGIIVVGKDGRTPGVGVAIPREMVGKFVSAIALGAGLAWVVFDRERQGWHDKIAGTYVVYKPDAATPLPLKWLARLARSDGGTKPPRNERP